MEIFSLFGSIFVDNQRANKAIDDTDAKGKGVAGTFGSMIGTAAKWGAGLLAGASVAVGGMLTLANKTAATADEIDKLSERTGINREELQRWKYAAGQSGADIGKLETGMKTLTDQMDKASNGNKAATSAFQRLGISLDDLKNKSQSQIFDQVMKSLANMEQGAARNALGNDVLGKSYTELLPLLNAGGEGMDALKARADELGIVMSEEAVKSNVQFGDTLSDLQQAFGAIFTQMGTALLPVLQTFINLIMENMPAIQAVIQVVFGVIGTLIDGFVAGLTWLINSIKQWVADNQETLTAIQQGFESFFGAVQEVAKAFFDILQRFWKTHGETIVGHLKVVWETVKGVFRGAFDAISGLWKIFSGVFTGDWKKVWDGIKQTFSGVWDGIVSIGKGAVNSIINVMNGMIRGLNKISFNIPSWVPLIGGKTWGFNLAQIPLLAEGGIIDQAGRVLVGEKGPEVLDLPKGAKVSPLDKAGTATVIHNDFRGLFEGMVNQIREEADIEKLAKKLFRMFHLAQQNKLQALGVEY